MARSTLVQFRAVGSFGGELDCRSDGNESEVARRDLTRYYQLLRRSLPEFSEEEWMIIHNACNGLLTYDIQTVPLLWAQVSDFCEAHNVPDCQPLIDRLRRLSLVECLAVIDEAERFWIG
jgi:hypothetical protein